MIRADVKTNYWAHVTSDDTQCRKPRPVLLHKRAQSARNNESLLLRWKRRKLRHCLSKCLVERSSATTPLLKLYLAAMHASDSKTELDKTSIRKKRFNVWYICEGSTMQIAARGDVQMYNI